MLGWEIKKISISIFSDEKANHQIVNYIAGNKGYCQNTDN